MEEYKGSGRRKSPVYNSYHILCRKELTISCGWLVCNHVITGNCELLDGVKRYKSTEGTKILLRHAKTHTSDDPRNNFGSMKLTGPPKDMIINSAAHACILDNLALGFCERKKGILKFATALVNIGQNIPSGRSVDIEDALPCGKTVGKEVKRIAAQINLNLKNLINQVLECGGAVTCDGVKCPNSGSKFYDFVLHYIQRPMCMFSRIEEWKNSTRVLFIVEHEDSEDALNIRTTIVKKLRSEYSIDLVFLERCSFVTDCAATMPRVFDASVSPNQIPFSDRWVGCISHQLNTVMKHVVESTLPRESTIIQSIDLVKKIVSSFKHASLNSKLVPGSALQQEVATRFGTACDVVERFTVAYSDVFNIAKNCHTDVGVKIRRYISDLVQLDDENGVNSSADGSETFPDLLAVVDVSIPSDTRKHF